MLTRAGEHKQFLKKVGKKQPQMVICLYAMAAKQDRFNI